MESSSYKVVLTSDATRGSTRYLQHYGVKGMKWGVVHDEEEKRRQAQSQPYVSPEYKAEVAYNSRKNAATNILPTQKSKTSAPVNISGASPEYLAERAYNSQKNNFSNLKPEQKTDPFREGAREGVQEALEKNQVHSVGEYVDKITSDEYREDVNYLQDIIIDELEERNPVVGQTLRAVDNFLDSVDSFISDFVKSANKIVGDIMSWGKKLFGG